MLDNNLYKGLSRQITTITKPNRKEVLTHFVTTKGREALTSIFGFHDNAAVVSYCPKKGKVVVLLSSMHSQVEINNNIPSKKPIIIMDYNSSKGGVDTADQMLRMYTTKRMTRRCSICPREKHKRPA